MSPLGGARSTAPFQIRPFHYWPPLRWLGDATGGAGLSAALRSALGLVSDPCCRALAATARAGSDDRSFCTAPRHGMAALLGPPLGATPGRGHRGARRR